MWKKMVEGLGEKTYKKEQTTKPKEEGKII